MGKTAVQTLPVVIELVLGFVAGVASRAVSTPLSVITVCLQTGNEDKEEANNDPSQRRRKRDTPLQVLKRIYDIDGLAGFWKGISLSFPLTFC